MTADPASSPEPPKIVVIVPAVDGDQIANGLRSITRRIAETGLGDPAGGILGGEWGYGADYENDMFQMRQFCWCEQPDCPWCRGCTCPEEAERYLVDGKPATFQAWIDAFDTGEPRERQPVPELQCGYCTGATPAAPNFWHKPSGSMIHWYKYIGRDMEIALACPWPQILEDCLGSLPPVT